MLFNSLQFLVFFPVVTAIYFLLPHKYRWLLLLLASCVFYMAFIPVYIFILFFTIIIDYAAGIIIEGAEGKKRKQFLAISIIANIGVLAVFKYYNFFIENTNNLMHALHISTNKVPFLTIILPIGLSFHTFQAMSYTIEVYRGNQKAEKHFGIYALYVMFYPQLVAGPIERPQNLLHQFREEHKFNSQDLMDGLRLMLWGFFKKMVIADRIALYVNSVFNFPDDYHYLNLIIAALFFTIQIYCDFSGYSDIAIGTAKTMGFDLRPNFNKPYFSKNIKDFWQKWHISLSGWFKDYLYISLGGNRVGIKRIYFNVAIVFLISGLWHGANWTFVIWGALHACYMLIYMLLYKKFKINFKSKLMKLFSVLCTFLLVAFAWIFFRANNLSDALLIAEHIFTGYSVQPFQMVVTNLSELSQFGIFSTLFSILMILVLVITEYKFPANLLSFNRTSLGDISFCTFILFLTIMLGVFNNSSFVYFQF